jgi:hypothetical protein
MGNGARGKDNQVVIKPPKKVALRIGDYTRLPSPVNDGSSYYKDSGTFYQYDESNNPIWSISATTWIGNGYFTNFSFDGVDFCIVVSSSTQIQILKVTVDGTVTTVGSVFNLAGLDYLPYSYGSAIKHGNKVSYLYKSSAYGAYHLVVYDILLDTFTDSPFLGNSSSSIYGAKHITNSGYYICSVNVRDGGIFKNILLVKDMKAININCNDLGIENYYSVDIIYYGKWVLFYSYNQYNYAGLTAQAFVRTDFDRWVNEKLKEAIL